MTTLSRGTGLTRGAPTEPILIGRLTASPLGPSRKSQEFFVPFNLLLRAVFLIHRSEGGQEINRYSLDLALRIHVSFGILF